VRDGHCVLDGCCALLRLRRVAFREAAQVQKSLARTVVTSLASAYSAR
jgi:hypothetical protein